MVPLSLYIHFPWCVKKCPYCDFNSHAVRDAVPEQRYLEKLFYDLHRDLSLVQGRSLQSIFMGGGTPSLFSAASIAKLLHYIQQQIDFVKDIEITLEANPGTIDQEKFAGFYAAGINRLSLGVQSFNAEILPQLGRIHNSRQAIDAIKLAQTVGFTNFNIDLMHGLPTQTVISAITDITTALSFSPPHISWYQLTLEPHTQFYQKPPQLPDETTLAEIQTQGHHLLTQKNYQHYEVSAYAQTGYQCIHNLNYWQFGDYLGIGAGAHAKITDLNTGCITRYAKVKHPREYLQSDALTVVQEIVSPQRLPFEFMLNALRLQRPLTYHLFEQRTFLSRNRLQEKCALLAEKQLLTYDNESITLTPLGKQFLNNVLTEFLE